jgi:hypothetical protein
MIQEFEGHLLSPVAESLLRTAQSQVYSEK